MADDMEQRLRAVEQGLAVVEQRLEGGSKSFESLRNSITDLETSMHNKVEETSTAVGRRLGTIEERITPRPLSTFKVAGIMLSVLMVIGGALWTASSLFGERPTHAQVERDVSKAVESHSATGHDDVTVKIEQIQRTQAEQTGEMREFRKQVKDDVAELKSLLLRRRR